MNNNIGLDMAPNIKIYAFRTVILLFLLFAADSLKVFKNEKQAIQCIYTCEKQITPCVALQNKKCQKQYKRCLEGSDPYNCMVESNNQEVRQIGKCFDQRCTELIQKQQISSNKNGNTGSNKVVFPWKAIKNETNHGSRCSNENKQNQKFAKNSNQKPGCNIPKGSKGKDKVDFFSLFFRLQKQ